MTQVHLICGLPCSGKTFFAKQLAKDLRALYLGLDEALTSLHGQYSIDEIGHDLHIKRVISARLNLWNIAKASFSVDVPVVLDYGFFLRQTRDRYRSLCDQARVEPVLYYLNTSITKIQARLAKRNAQLPGENFFITSEMFERMVKIFLFPKLQQRLKLAFDVL
jgi:predicted kinase